MVRGYWLAALLVAAGLSGCLGNDPSGNSGEADPPNTKGSMLESYVDEALPPSRATFPGAEGAPPVIGLLWMPANQTNTVLVGVPGGCGLKETLGPRDWEG